MDIEIKSQPFTEAQLKKLKQNLRRGYIRRFGAVCSHQKLDFSHNALIAWDKRYLEKAIREKLKEKDYISHIYLRKTHRLWPFGLYTMVHAKTKEGLDAYIKEISDLLGRCEFRILNTLREFKKTSFNPSPRMSIFKN